AARLPHLGCGGGSRRPAAARPAARRCEQGRRRPARRRCAAAPAPARPRRHGDRRAHVGDDSRAAPCRADVRQLAVERPGLVGGGPCPPALLDRARAAGVAVAQTYGLTEACSQVTTARPGDTAPDAGPPLFCTRVWIEDGEICVRSPTVAPQAGPVLRTGDL